MATAELPSHMAIMAPLENPSTARRLASTPGWAPKATSASKVSLTYRPLLMADGDPQSARLPRKASTGNTANPACNST